MFRSTLDRICCPLCSGKLALETRDTGEEIRSGIIDCVSCDSDFLIVGGVAILIDNWAGYLLDHVKGVSRVVEDDEIPEEFRDDFVEARAEIEPEHIEEDLEAERVTALYVATQWLNAKSEAWWKPKHGVPSPHLDRLIREYWDSGPMSVAGAWISEKNPATLVEIGCGVGGLAAKTKGVYLGLDQSFASIAVARHLAFGAKLKSEVKIPGDLIDGQVSRGITITPPCAPDGRVDFVVADLSQPPLLKGSWDCAVALNAIDMLEEPGALPRLQYDLLSEGGYAIQSCPYIWHGEVARALKASTGAADSASAVKALYAEERLNLLREIDHVPWLFFKHSRQIELYSVHVFESMKGARA